MHMLAPGLVVQWHARLVWGVRSPGSAGWSQGFPECRLQTARWSNPLFCLQHRVQPECHGKHMPCAQQALGLVYAVCNAWDAPSTVGVAQTVPMGLEEFDTLAIYLMYHNYGHYRD